MANESATETGTGSVGWRFKFGIALFVLAFLLWLFIPQAAVTGLPASKIAALTGTIFITNKLLLLAVIGVMGKAGFQQLKGMLFGYAGKLAPDAIVSSTRYRMGLVMFCLPLISGWLEPYVDTLAPGLRPNLWQLQLLGDLMLVASFFVLGGNFWAKVRALFVRTAVVADPGDAAPT
ncbi:transporter suffix domain-containing protein [Dankookia sp. GCM10030260]|uniref:transporter suffix domain-containing protein n=1 Tax=Dankookia sp. GCM10030260 TaxID=3273390 RepID=UPI003613167A